MKAMLVGRSAYSTFSLKDGSNMGGWNCHFAYEINTNGFEGNAVFTAYVKENQLHDGLTDLKVGTEYEVITFKEQLQNSFGNTVNRTKVSAVFPCR